MVAPRDNKVVVEFGPATRRRLDRMTKAMAELAENTKKVRTAVDAMDPELDSNLVQHVKRECEIAGFEGYIRDAFVDIAKVWASMGHSGGSHMVLLPMLNELLDFHNIMPLTDDPEEWVHHGEEMWGSPGGVWQNRRNGEAFSKDGGKTYYLLSEGGSDLAYKKGETEMHTSKSHVQLKAVQEAEDS